MSREMKENCPVVTGFSEVTWFELWGMQQSGNLGPEVTLLQSPLSLMAHASCFALGDLVVPPYPTPGGCGMGCPGTLTSPPGYQASSAAGLVTKACLCG